MSPEQHMDKKMKRRLIIGLLLLEALIMALIYIFSK